MIENTPDDLLKIIKGLQGVSEGLVENLNITKEQINPEQGAELGGLVGEIDNMFNQAINKVAEAGVIATKKR